MSTWLQKQSLSHQSQLAATAVVSSVLVATAIFSIQALRRKIAVEDLKASIPRLDENHHAEKLTEYGAPSGSSGPFPISKEDERSLALAIRARQGDYDEELVLEQLARNRVFLGDEGLAALRSSFVIIVGCGGVGSHAAAALARSGVSRIRLIDFDQVTLSSLNRHALATLADVGTPKVFCIKKRLEAIVPWVHFDCLNQLFGTATAAAQLGPFEGQQATYIIDAIDNIDSKVALLSYCHAHNLPVISSMGAGCKSDPTRLFIGDISESIEDPLSRATRRRLRLLGITSGITVAYSTEKPGPGKASLQPLAEAEFAKGSVDELSVLPDFRVRILPVLGTMPAIFGHSIANYVILSISQYPHDQVTIKFRPKLYDAVLASLQGSEERLARAFSDVKDIGIGLRIPVSKDDVAYLLEEVWRGKSAISGLSTRLVLVRWRRNGRADLGEDKEDDASGLEPIAHDTGTQKLSKVQLGGLVCMTKEEAMQHEVSVLVQGKRVDDVYTDEVLARVRQRMVEEKEYEKYR